MRRLVFINLMMPFMLVELEIRIERHDEGWPCTVF